MPEPWPAPDWISTRWPERCSSSTPTGVIATRDSCVLISLGTPTTYLSPLGIAKHPCLKGANGPNAARHRVLPPHSGRGGRVNQEQQAGGMPRPWGRLLFLRVSAPDPTLTNRGKLTLSRRWSARAGGRSRRAVANHCLSALQAPSHDTAA